MAIRTSFKCLIVESSASQFSLCTGIQVNVPPGLTRQEAVDYVTGKIAHEVANYAASEALGLGPTSNSTDWKEKVT